MEKYEIGKLLGNGAFGSVNKVISKIDRKEYAMKRVNMAQLEEKEKENALNEVRILASFEHPNIIGYKDAFYDEISKTLNIVMELADDGDIESKIEYNKKNKLSFQENTIWNILIQILQGLKFLHDNKIIHRDLKSANIFLMKNGLVKIGDLNVSKLAKIGKANTRTGTPYYSSPEIWIEQQYNNKTDIWSVGCIIYEMCSLYPPFRGTSFINLYNNIQKGVYSPIPDNYSKELNYIISLMLVVDPNFRASCDKLLNSNIVVEKMKEIKGIHYSNQNNLYKVELIQTIKLPKKLKDINKILPHKKKKHMEKEMMMNDEFETKKAGFFKNVTKENNNMNNNNNNFKKHISHSINKPNHNQNIHSNQNNIKRPMSALQRVQKKIIPNNQKNNINIHHMNNNYVRPSSGGKNLNSINKSNNNNIGNNNNKIKIKSKQNDVGNNMRVRRPASAKPSQKKGLNINNKSNNLQIKNKGNIHSSKNLPYSSNNSHKNKIIEYNGNNKKGIVIEKINYNRGKKYPISKPSIAGGYKPKIGNRK